METTRIQRLFKRIGVIYFVITAPFVMAFAIQYLWNWFVASAIHGPKISSEQAGGFMILIVVIRQRTFNELVSEAHFKKTETLIKWAVPDELRGFAHKQAEEVENNEDERKMRELVKIGETLVLLAFGWLIHMGF